MSQALRIIDELEATLKSNSSERHLSILKKVTGLFLAGHDRLTEEVALVFDDVMLRLIEYVESWARIELSRQVAPIANAPEHVIRRLARDDNIAVAGPVLAQSPRLTDENLVAIAESMGQLHLSKIAERAALSPTVTDALVDRGNREVVTKVAVNAGARFSSTGMSMLAMRASGDDDLTEVMTRRPDISPALLKRLLSQATEEVRQRMLAAARPSQRDVINRVLTQIAVQAGAMTISEKDFAAAERLVHSFSRDTNETRRKVLQFADGRRIAELVAALSILSGVPIALVSRLICDSEPFGAMVLCKAIGLEWMVAHAVISNFPGMSEEREKRLEEMRDHYEHLSTGSAGRLLGYWEACQVRRELPRPSAI